MPNVTRASCRRARAFSETKRVWTGQVNTRMPVSRLMKTSNAGTESTRIGHESPRILIRRLDSWRFVLDSCRFVCCLSEGLQQHLHHPRQSALGVADELLEDLVRDRHELFHAGQPLPRELDRLLPGGDLADRLL